MIENLYNQGIKNPHAIISILFHQYRYTPAGDNYNEKVKYVFKEIQRCESAKKAKLTQSLKDISSATLYII